MKIGIFDSGLGGLFIAKSIVEALPNYHYVYLGDTKNLPYGNKNQTEIYGLLARGVEYLFRQNCKLIIVACNTASASALRKIQRSYLPKYYFDRRVLGVIRPTAEIIKNKKYRSIGILATPATVRTKSFVKEIYKLNPKVTVYQRSAPLLVPMIEANNKAGLEIILERYLNFFKNKVDAIILGCTHYSIIKKEIIKIVGNKIDVICETDIISEKLKKYLNNHAEIKSTLIQKKRIDFKVTKINKTFESQVKKWFGSSVTLKLVWK